MQEGVIDTNIDNLNRLIPKAVGLQQLANKDGESAANELYGEKSLMKEVMEQLAKEKEYTYYQFPSRSVKNKILLRKYLNSLKFFETVDVDVFCENAKLKVFQKDQDVFDLVHLTKERYFYVVLFGFVSMYVPQLSQSEEKEKICSQTFSKGETFGEKCIIDSLRSEIPKSKNVTWRSSGAVNETGVLCLNWELYKKQVFPQHEFRLLKKSQFLRNLVVPIFHKYMDNILLEFSKVLKERSYAAGDVIYKQGDPGTEMFFLLEGECNIVKYLRFGSRVRYFHLASLKKGEYFGEIAFLVHSHIPLKRDWSVFARTKTKVLVLDKLGYTTFVERSKKTEEMLKTYSEGYPTDRQIREVFEKNEKWKDYKKNLLKDLKRDIQLT